MSRKAIDCFLNQRNGNRRILEYITLLLWHKAVIAHFQLPQPKRFLCVYCILLVVISTSFIYLNGVFEFNIKFNPP